MFFKWNASKPDDGIARLRMKDTFSIFDNVMVVWFCTCFSF